MFKLYNYSGFEFSNQRIVMTLCAKTLCSPLSLYVYDFNCNELKTPGCFYKRSSWLIHSAESSNDNAMGVKVAFMEC